MPVFAYKGIDEQGRAVGGTLTADSPPAGRQELRDREVQLIEFREVAFAEKRQQRICLRPGKRRDQIAEFARQLALLLRSGITVVECMDVLISQQRGGGVAVLRDVRDKVASGVSLSEAFECHPDWFDEVFCTAVRVGHESGCMDRALMELAAFLRERQTLRSKFVGALAYPMILCVVGFGVVLFLMTYVMPNLLGVLEASGRPLPWATQVMKGIADGLIAHWFGVVLSVLGIAGAVFALLRYPPTRRWWDGIQLRLPLAGPLLTKALISQFAQTMSLLLRSGVQFLDAVRLVRSRTRHLVLADELSRMETAIQRGADIASTMGSSRVFPPLVVHIMNVGQATGELTEMLEELDTSYRSEVRLALGTFVTALEPLLIVGMSAVVGFIVFATMMPILEATRAIG